MNITEELDIHMTDLNNFIGRHCPLIRKLHLTLWREDMADLHSMQVIEILNLPPCEIIWTIDKKKRKKEKLK